MRGITPVIAIILLLLMTVAAAGGFYFIYQRFSSEGEDSGARQIDQFGQQALSSMTIESAAGGRIYIRNTGATTLDLEHATLHVEGAPVEMERSIDKLDERSRAILKLTQLPGCTSEKCEVTITGPASTSQTIDLSRLICSTDGDCYPNEICDGGICVEAEPGDCGDGICGPGEDGMNCFEDCGPRSLAMSDADSEAGFARVYEYLWNGLTYEKGDALAEKSYSETSFSMEFSPSGKGLLTGPTGGAWNDPTSEMFWSYYDGNEWSPTVNLTDNEWAESGGIQGIDFSETDEAMTVWTTGSEMENIAWAMFDGSEWSSPQNLTGNSAYEIRVDGPGPDFEFGPEGKGYVIWPSHGSGDLWVNYTLWDGGWGETGTITAIEDDPLFHKIHFVSLNSNQTHFMALWLLQYEYITESFKSVIQWSVSDGTGWSTVKNVTDDLGAIGGFSFQPDADGNWMLMVLNVSSTPTNVEWWHWQEGWEFQGEISEEPLNKTGFLKKNENNAIYATLHEMEGHHMYGPSAFIYWDGTDWVGPVDFE